MSYQTYQRELRAAQNTHRMTVLGSFLRVVSGERTYEEHLEVVADARAMLDAITEEAGNYLVASAS